MPATVADLAARPSARERIRRRIAVATRPVAGRPKAGTCSVARRPESRLERRGRRAHAVRAVGSARTTVNTCSPGGPRRRGGGAARISGRELLVGTSWPPSDRLAARCRRSADLRRVAPRRRTRRPAGNSRGDDREAFGSGRRRGTVQAPCGTSDAIGPELVGSPPGRRRGGQQAAAAGARTIRAARSVVGTVRAPPDGGTTRRHARAVVAGRPWSGTTGSTPASAADTRR